MALVALSVSAAVPSHTASRQESGAYSLRRKKSSASKAFSRAASSPSRTRSQNTSFGTQPVLA